MRLLLHFSACLVLLPACDRGPGQASRPASDSAFTQLQQRGEAAMGVDQYTSSHLFDALADGGRIELQRDVDDPEGVATIREHLLEIAARFNVGDFQVPGFVHAQTVPGTDVMAAKRDRITYDYSDLPRGGQIRITTGDAGAVRAIHAFLAFQRQDHRAAGHVHEPDGSQR